MESKYDSIKYLPALIQDVRQNGVLVDADSILRMHDIIKHTATDTLIHFAAGKDMFGETPKSEEEKSEAHFKQNALFAILFHVWGWERTAEFYLLHATPGKKTIQKLQEENASLQTQIKLLRKTLSTSSSDLTKLTQENELLSETICQKDEEITRLKAQMFDLITKGEKQGEK